MDALRGDHAAYGRIVRTSRNTVTAVALALTRAIVRICGTLISNIGVIGILAVVSLRGAG